MAITWNLKNLNGGCQSQSQCLDKFGCPSDRCPDFYIRRHDTKPPLKVLIEDCDGPIDLRGLVIEANMWALAKLKRNLDATTDYFALANDIGFEQIMVGDIIIMDRVRMPEYMLVTAFDETNKFVQVERGWRGTTASTWKKGQSMRIFRVLNAPASSEMVFQDIQNVDGTTDSDVLTESYLVYDWQPEDTCLPGCYWLEFKVIKMQAVVYFLPGGDWSGETHRSDDGFYYTGSTHTDSSVRLSYDQVNELFLLPEAVWTGENHEYSGHHFTGTVHNDGSVPLNQTGVPVEDGTSLDETTLLSILSTSSIIPTFESGLTAYQFGCILGEGVEWVRRYPLDGEGFLVRVEDSPTVEI